MNCTGEKGRLVEHSSNPEQTTESESKSEISIMAREAIALDNLKSGKAEALETFFDKYLTNEFFINHASRKDPRDQHSLYQFHLNFITSYRQETSEQEALKTLAHRYYNRLKSLCHDEFNDCDIIVYLKDSVYAADVFLAANSLIDREIDPQYIMFLTSIGHPENNPHIGTIKVEEIIDKIEKDGFASHKTLAELNNGLIFNRSSKKQTEERALLTLYSLATKENSPKRYHLAFEKLLQLALNDESTNEFAESLSKKYTIAQVRKTDILEILKLENSNGLIRWSKSYPDYSVDKDWKAIFILYGLMAPSRVGDFHNSLARKFLSEGLNKKNFMTLVESYIFKSFKRNAYLSHEKVGARFLKKIEESGDNLEQVITDLSSEADVELSEIWRHSYAEKLKYIEESLYQFYSSSEIDPLRNVLIKLDLNIRNIVGYPFNFIIGYYAMKQGDFNLSIMTPNKSTINRDAGLYFHGLFNGSFSQTLTSIQAEKGTAEDILLSFYLSMDETILSYYGIDINFPEEFAQKYLASNTKKITDLTAKINTFFANNTVADEFRDRCEKINKSDMNFSYDVQFKQARQLYFKGPIYYDQSNQGITQGTSAEMNEYWRFYNYGALDSMVTEDLEDLRLELGPKLLRMRILSAALNEQGFTSQQKAVESKLTKAERSATDLIELVRKTYQENVTCALVHERVETKMRKHFFVSEIDYVKSTFWALKILNEFNDPSLDISEVREKYPDIFNTYLFDSFPEQGNFLDELNKHWLAVGNVIKNKISGYHDNITPRLGFARTEYGLYVFNTSVMEDDFRRYHYFSETAEEGKEFPIVKIQNIPSTEKLLLVQYGNKEELYYRWAFDESVKTPEDYVFKIFDSVYKRKPFGLAFHEIYAHHNWEMYWVNYAALLKAKAYFKASSRLDYHNYRNIMEPLRVDFENFLSVVFQVLDGLNIDETEEYILTLLKEHNMKRDDQDGAFPYHGQKLFITYAGTFARDLGYLDRFFLALTAYQLGENAEFRENLYGAENPTSDVNPLLLGWKPTKTKNQKILDGYGGQVFSSDDVTIRSSIFGSTQRNAKIVNNWDEDVLFKIRAPVKSYIFHNLYQIVSADHALTDEFLDWIKVKERRGDKKIPYRLEMDRRNEFHDNPPYVQDVILERYIESREFFHSKTYNLFKEKEQAIDHGP